MTDMISISASFERKVSFFDRWGSFFRVLSLRGIINKYAEIWYYKILDKIIAWLDDLLLLVSGAIVVVDNYDSSTAKAELKKVVTVLQKFSKIEAILNKYEYLGSEEIKFKIDKCITLLYDIEFRLRKRAFENAPLIKSEQDFITELSNKSKLSISKSLD